MIRHDEYIDSQTKLDNVGKISLTGDPMNFRHKYWIAVIEFPCIIAGALLLYPRIGFWGLLGVFLSFVGFELHLIYHRIEREENQRRKAKEQA